MMTNDAYLADREVEETLKRALTVLDRGSAAPDLRVQLLAILRGFLMAGERWRSDLAIQSSIYEKLNRPFFIGAQKAASQASLASTLMSIEFEDREALVLNASERLDHRQAAEMCGCDIIVYEERLYRGLTRLAELMAGENPGKTGSIEATESQIGTGRMRSGKGLTKGASYLAVGRN
jgi:hypothetical protein